MPPGRETPPQSGELEQVANTLGDVTEEAAKALMQMRSPRPETTRGTVNMTLAAHKVFLNKRIGVEPLSQTVDRFVDELRQPRAEEAALAARTERRGAKPQASQLSLF